MATTDTGAVGAADDPAQEVAHARRLAERYHVEFVDMDAFTREVRNMLSPYMGLSLHEVNSGRLLIEATRIGDHG